METPRKFIIACTIYYCNVRKFIIACTIYYCIFIYYYSYLRATTDVFLSKSTLITTDFNRNSSGKMRCPSLWLLSQCYLALKNMILGFDFLGFQVIKNFPTKNRIFLHIMQCTITNNSFLLVFYSYVLVFYPYVTGMYLVCTRMLLVRTRMYSYVTCMYLYVTRMYSCGVLVTIRQKGAT